MSIYQKLGEIQQKLNAPKDKVNKFGGYNYRSCEGILEAVKPLLKLTSTALTITDEVVEVGGRVFVKATATLWDADEHDLVAVSAYAREEETKKGMDAAQITGSASSYARKYALNGLFAIDDNKDPDDPELSNNVQESKKDARKPANTYKLIDKDQADIIRKAYEGNEEKLQKFLENRSVKKLEMLRWDHAQALIDRLEGRS